MNWVIVEIVVITMVVFFLVAIIGSYIYKKIHHIPTGDCAACQARSKKLLKEYHKMYPKKVESK